MDLISIGTIDWDDVDLLRSYLSRFTHFRFSMSRQAANAERALRFLRRHGLRKSGPQGAVDGNISIATPSVLPPLSASAGGSLYERTVAAGGLDVVQVEASQSAIFNRVIVATATSSRHARAIAEEVSDTYPNSTITDRKEPWVVVDTNTDGSVLHVMTEEQREEYRPEYVWKRDIRDDPIRNEAEEEWAISDKDPINRRL